MLFLQIHPAVPYLNFCFDSTFEVCQRNENSRFLKQVPASFTCKLNTEKKLLSEKQNTMTDKLLVLIQ